MEELNILKLVLESIVAVAVLGAVVLFLRDRRESRKADFADRQAERSALLGLVGNHIGEGRRAMQAVAESEKALAGAITQLATRIEGCPHRGIVGTQG